MNFIEIDLHLYKSPKISMKKTCWGIYKMQTKMLLSKTIKSLTLKLKNSCIFMPIHESTNNDSETQYG